MPVHDWTRVSAGTFHHFHSYWVGEIGKALNAGLLPQEYYAMAEQVAGNIGPDVITLQSTYPEGEEPANGSAGGVAVAVAPRVDLTDMTEEDLYVLRRRSLVIRHGSEDRIVALVEILSPGNKGSRHALRSFLDKAAGALRAGIHLLLVDLHPPTPRDPQGIHLALWSEFTDRDFALPPDRPLTLAAYTGGAVKKAYVTFVAAGDTLPDMPLFLTPEVHVPVPLEATYRTAFDAVPRRWRDLLEPPGAGS